MLMIQYICVVVAAILLGNWYLSEARKLKAMGKAWYRVYFSTPGLLILAVVLLLPLIVKAI